MNLLLERITKKKKKKKPLCMIVDPIIKNRKKKITFFTQLAYPDLHD